MEHFQDNMIVLMVEDAIMIQMESQNKSLKLKVTRSVVSNSLGPHGIYRPWNLQARILE